MAIEFELKYRASAAVQEALLARVDGDFRIITMETTYYDTPKRALSVRKITLRRRMENAVSVCTVKTPAGAAGRGEWECEESDISAAIKKLCKLGAPEILLPLCSLGLEPVCGARFIRRAVDVVTAEFTAELALDAGVLLGGNRELPLTEVELELKSGRKTAMILWMEALAGEFGLVPETKSKFRRALDLAEGG